jgi:periplasmic protein TonB
VYLTQTSSATRSGVLLMVVVAHIAVIYAVAVSLGVVETPLIDELTPAVFIETQIEKVEPVPPENPPAPSQNREIEIPVPEVPPITPPETVSDVSPDTIQVAALPEPAGPAPAVEATSLEVTRRVEPVYPQESRRMDEQGVVRLRVLVDERGRPREVQVAQSSGFERLDEAAVSAMRRWHFAPATQASQAVSAWTHVRVVFQLNR